MCCIMLQEIASVVACTQIDTSVRALCVLRPSPQLCTANWSQQTLQQPFLTCFVIQVLDRRLGRRCIQSPHTEEHAIQGCRLHEIRACPGTSIPGRLEKSHNRNSSKQ